MRETRTMTLNAQPDTEVENFATISEPLRGLTKKYEPFVYGKHSFREMKNRLSCTKTLAYFVKKSTTRGIEDTSPVELGAILGKYQCEDYCIISYVSRGFTHLLIR